MSHVRGSFGINVQFTDSTTTSIAKSLKSIGIQHATEYDFGKVAVVSGTCGAGTAAVSVTLAPTTYRNSEGDAVSFSTVSRVAFAAEGAGLVRLAGTNNFFVYSRAGQPAVSEAAESVSFSVSCTAGTTSYTLVMYGS
jgi:hypothetical protein